ncbi:MAG: hypothetical protein LUC45_09055 [Paraprevotella sp.]|nr:hypothetical protein [Paraprevotella sp.]
MNEKNTRRNLQTSLILCILCLLILLASLLLRWTEIAVGMGALALIQAYIAYIWWKRMRHPRTHFQERKHGKR